MRGICTNCMAFGNVRNVPVGNDKGHQRDPYRDQIPLCSLCEEALGKGSLREFHERYEDSTTVYRDALEPEKETDGRVT